MGRESTASTLRPWLALTVTVMITVIAGRLYGKYSNRWGPSPDLAAAAAHLEDMPSTVGSWTLAEERPISTVAVEMLECAGYVNRCYVNEKTGQSISLAIIVGPPGPTAVHTPEICYSSRAYEKQGDRKLVRLEATPADAHTFWSVDFSTRNVMADRLRVYYAWSRGQSWEASKSPRFEFGAAPLLYKIQLAAAIPPNLDQVPLDGGYEFLEQLAQSGWKLTAN